MLYLQLDTAKKLVQTKQDVRGTRVMLDETDTALQQKLFATRAETEKLSPKFAELKSQLEYEMRALDDEILEECTANHRTNLSKIQLMERALCGDMELVMVPSATSEDISAALLNGENTPYVMPMEFALKTKDGLNVHAWFNGDSIITIDATFNDEDIEDPTFLHGIETPRFINGVCAGSWVWDWDGGDTKVYAANDLASLKIQVAVDDKWLTFSVAFKQHTFNVIA